MDLNFEPRTDQFLSSGFELLNDMGQHHFIITCLLAQFFHRLWASWGEELFCYLILQDKAEALIKNICWMNKWVNEMNRMVSMINLVLKYADKKCGHEAWLVLLSE